MKKKIFCGVSVMSGLFGIPLLAASCTGEVNPGPNYENLGGSSVTATGVGGTSGTAVTTAASTTGTPGCAVGLTNCGNGVCLDLLSDGANCGGCGVACLPGQVCSGGVCSVTCADPSQAMCGQSCVDLLSNPQNCGSCGVACIAQSCYQGICQCQPGLMQCGSSCVDLQSDPLNCGGCGLPCAAGSACSFGICSAGVTTGGVTSAVTTATATTGNFGNTTTVTNTTATATTGNNFGNTTTATNTVSTTASTATSTTGGAGVTFAQVAAIVDQSCGAATCHGGRENPPLTNDANLYNTLLSDTVRQCGNNALITPNNAATSALLMLVNGQCGNLIMPEGCQNTPCWSAADIATVTAWINAGAPQ